MHIFNLIMTFIPTAIVAVADIAVAAIVAVADITETSSSLYDDGTRTSDRRQLPDRVTCDRESSMPAGK